MSENAACPVCQRVVDGGEKELAAHVNSCLDQQRNVDTVAACQICKKNISSYTSTQRTQHMNRCCDRVSKPSGNDVHTQPDAGADTADFIPTTRMSERSCPTCGKAFKNKKGVLAHVKKCPQKQSLSVDEVAAALEQQENGSAVTNAPSASTRAVTSSTTRSSRTTRSTQGGTRPTRSNTRKRVKIQDEDEDTQVALALSTSLVQTKLVAPDTRARPGARKKSKQTSASKNEVPVLLQRSASEQQAVVAARAGNVILGLGDDDGDDDDSMPVSCTPAFATSRLASSVVSPPRVRSAAIPADHACHEQAAGCDSSSGATRSDSPSRSNDRGCPAEGSGSRSGPVSPGAEVKSGYEGAAEYSLSATAEAGAKHIGAVSERGASEESDDEKENKLPKHLELTTTTTTTVSSAMPLDSMSETSRSVQDRQHTDDVGLSGLGSLSTDPLRTLAETSAGTSSCSSVHPPSQPVASNPYPSTRLKLTRQRKNHVQVVGKVTDFYSVPVASVHMNDNKPASQQLWRLSAGASPLTDSDHFYVPSLLEDCHQQRPCDLTSEINRLEKTAHEEPLDQNEPANNMLMVSFSQRLLSSLSDELQSSLPRPSQHSTGPRNSQEGGGGFGDDADTSGGSCEGRNTHRAAAVDTLLTDLSAMMTSSRFSDAILVASDGSQLPVHKVILAARSPVFSQMLEENNESVLFDESTLNASGWSGLAHQPVVLRFDEQPCSVLVSLVAYLYSGTLPSEHDAEVISGLYSLAARLKLSVLQSYCAPFLPTSHSLDKEKPPEPDTVAAPTEHATADGNCSSESASEEAPRDSEPILAELSIKVVDSTLCTAVNNFYASNVVQADGNATSAANSHLITDRDGSHFENSGLCLADFRPAKSTSSVSTDVTSTAVLSRAESTALSPDVSSEETNDEKCVEHSPQQVGVGVRMDTSAAAAPGHLPEEHHGMNHSDAQQDDGDCDLAAVAEQSPVMSAGSPALFDVDSGDDDEQHSAIIALETASNACTVQQAKGNTNKTLSEHNSIACSIVREGAACYRGTDENDADQDDNNVLATCQDHQETTTVVPSCLSVHSSNHDDSHASTPPSVHGVPGGESILCNNDIQPSAADKSANTDTFERHSTSDTETSPRYNWSTMMSVPEFDTPVLVPDTPDKHPRCHTPAMTTDGAGGAGGNSIVSCSTRLFQSHSSDQLDKSDCAGSPHRGSSLGMKRGSLTGASLSLSSVRIIPDSPPNDSLLDGNQMASPMSNECSLPGDPRGFSSSPPTENTSNDQSSSLVHPEADAISIASSARDSVCSPGSAAPVRMSDVDNSDFYLNDAGHNCDFDSMSPVLVHTASTPDMSTVHEVPLLTSAAQDDSDPALTPSPECRSGFADNDVDDSGDLSGVLAVRVGVDHDSSSDLASLSSVCASRPARKSLRRARGSSTDNADADANTDGGGSGYGGFSPGWDACHDFDDIAVDTHLDATQTDCVYGDHCDASPMHTSTVSAGESTMHDSLLLAAVNIDDDDDGDGANTLTPQACQQHDSSTATSAGPPTTRAPSATHGATVTPALPVRARSHLTAAATAAAGSSGGSSASSGGGPITPMPNYDNMATPEVRARADQFGIRKLPKKRAIALLKHIYDYTHQPDTAKSRSAARSNAEQREADDDDDDVSDDNAANNGEEDSDDADQDDDVLTSVGNESQRSGDESGAEQDVDMAKQFAGSMLELDVDGDDDTAGFTATQMVSNDERMFKELYQFLRTNKQFLERILLYQPLDFAALNASLRQAAIRCSQRTLVKFLDSQCIVFR
eukprot:scpid32534/ scgid30721/ Structure-specific endonuclease subunit SLX4; BTB/POZ domain-containing protein 12